MEDSEEYLLKWNSHNAELVNEFHDLCREELFTDVTLAAEDVTFEAHRMVLSACSPYFKQLLTSTRCKHPVIFLKDISSEHMGLLLKYMYLGQIAVRKEDLNSILKSADHLRIRGLTTSTQTEAQGSNDPHVVLMGSAEEEDKSKNIIHANPNNNHNKGRKGYLPKRLRSLRPSGDTASDVSSPRCLSEPAQPLSPSGSGSSQRRNSGGAVPTNSCQSPDKIGEEAIMTSLEAEAMATTTEEEEEDQPVDFSQTSGNSGNATNKSPRYSILSNYLKTGKIGGQKQQPLHKPIIEEDEAASISKAAESLAASWLEQSLTAMQTDEEKDENKKKKRENVPLQESLGIDIADRLRSHFLSNLPAQSYNWLNNANNTKGLTNGNTGARNSLQTSLAAVSGKPAVTCEICGKKLADPSSLYRHRKIHSGDKPHKCPYCARRFIQRYNMKQHIKTHRMERMTDAEKAEYLPRPRQPQNVSN